jgi:hypothetical protein
MMSNQDPSAALLRAAGLALINKTVAGAQVFSDFVQAGEARPYLLMAIEAGAERNNWLDVRDPSFNMIVRCIADVAADARTGRNQALELLNRKGVNQEFETPLDGGEDWYISSTNVEGLLQLPPYMMNNIRRYDYGFNLFVKMFQKG